MSRNFQCKHDISMALKSTLVHFLQIATHVNVVFFFVFFFLEKTGLYEKISASNDRRNYM